MADVISSGKVTVYGANGKADITGVTTYNMISMAYTGNFTLTEKENSEGNVAGAVASDIREDLTLTFYPVNTAQSDPTFKALALPAIMSVVTVTQSGPDSPYTTPSDASGSIPTSVLGTYNYIGGGRMEFTAAGLMTMTLPLRRWAGAALT